MTMSVNGSAGYDHPAAKDEGGKMKDEWREPGSGSTFSVMLFHGVKSVITGVFFKKCSVFSMDAGWR